MSSKENYNFIFLFLIIIIIFNINKIIANVNGAEEVVMGNKNPEVIFQANSENENNYKEAQHPTTMSEVVFIPNEKTIDEIYFQEHTTVGINLVNILEGKRDLQRSLQDVTFNKELRVETESPIKDDIIFYEGKNNEPVDRIETERDKSYRPPRKEKDRESKLNCQNLNCDNKLNVTCGMKLENQIWKYRSFMNDCYFRKVNCRFKNAENRYIEVDNSYCKNVSSHGKLKTYQDLNPLRSDKKQKDIYEQTRRLFASRRSSNIQINGILCSHNCPITCTETYAPECAMSENGTKRVFLNHCKLDFTSCSENSAWRRLPMEECIGRKKTEFKENRAFIGWMQKTGIIDGRGRLAIT